MFFSPAFKSNSKRWCVVSGGVCGVVCNSFVVVYCVQFFKINEFDT